MSLFDFLAVTRRTLRKAMAWKQHFENLADAAESVGCELEAEGLRAIGARAVPSAEAYLESLHVEGV